MRVCRRTLLAAVLITAASACTPARPATAPRAPLAPPRPAGPVVLTIVGTNDLHGHIDTLPILAGYLANLRALRAGDGGVVLLDGGDMFQGTLESNLTEGTSVIEAYNGLGYDAAAIGNHEFDFGPVGERATPRPGDDPRGALKARAAQARFPFLAANLLDALTRRPVAWPNTRPSMMIEVAGVKIGVIGVSTKATPAMTIATNFAGLAIAPLAVAIAAEAAVLRERGATVVLVAAHAGGACKAFADVTDLSSCKLDEEIVEVARDLPVGLVDVIVGGHTHAGMAHSVAGIAVIESYSRGQSFGRVDLTVDRGKVTGRTIYPPRQLCDGAAERAESEPCRPGVYEGRAVEPDPATAALVERYRAMAAAIRERPLGVTIEQKVRRSYGAESALGNLVTDLMLAARPQADVAVTNGGGLRADLPAGPLTYGAVYEALPFDNRLAFISLTAAELAQVIAANLGRSIGVLSIAGMTAEARCTDGKLVVDLRRPDGKKITPSERLSLVTSDFLAVGGDGTFGRLALPAGSIQVEDGAPLRDEVVAVLRKRGGTIRGDALVDRAKPRLRYAGDRPVRCPGRPEGDDHEVEAR